MSALAPDRAAGALPDAPAQVGRVACPKSNVCEAHGFENPGDLAAHLIHEHGMSGGAALAKAREVAGFVRQASTKVSKDGTFFFGYTVGAARR